MNTEEILWKAIKGTPIDRIIKFMLKTEFDHTIQQIANNSITSRTPVRLLIDRGVLIRSREDDKSKYYQLSVK